MNFCPIFGTLAAVALCGCATAPPLPREAAAVTLAPMASDSIGVLRPSWRVVDGQLALEGWVYKKVQAKTTEHTHLDVVFLDATGESLRDELVEFFPRKLRRAPRPPAGRGHYYLSIPDLPSGTVRITVEAHDGEHGPVS